MARQASHSGAEMNAGAKTPNIKPETRPDRSKRNTRAFCGLFMLIGAVAIGCGAWTLLRSLRCQHWPTTEGVIEEAEMEQHETADTEQQSSSFTYSANVSYSYQVAGIHYEGTRLAIGAMSASSNYARGILDRYPVGKKVSVHYAPDNPELAVLETGIHGGTWIALGVGTLFVLFGWMILQWPSSANRAGQTTSATQSNVGLQQPPMLMGVIFMLMGSFVFFMEPADGNPHWILYAVGGFFVVAGLFVLALHLQNKLYSKILMWAFLLTFLVIFHWVSFGPGERIGTTTTPFSQYSGVNVRTPFAVFTVLLDMALLAGGVRWLLKGREN
jgi:hypothetical protein